MLLQANDYLLAARARRLRAPDRRLRPVGQHRCRASTSSAGARGTAVHALALAAAHRAPTARSSARRPAARVWLDPDADQPVPASSSTGCRSTTPRCGAFLLQFTLLPLERDRRDRRPSTTPAPERRGGPAAPGPRGDRAGARRRGGRGRRGGRRRCCSAAIPRAAGAAALAAVAGEVPTTAVDRERARPASTRRPAGRDRAGVVARATPAARSQQRGVA